MFPIVKTYTSVAYAEPQEELNDQFGTVYQASWSDIQHCSPLHEEKTPALWQVKRVRGITLAGGNPSSFIIRQSGSEIQYRLYMQAYKIMGIDRPAIRRWHPLSDEKRNEIISDYAAGMSIKSIVMKYDIADSQIYQSMRVMETNIKRERHRPVTDELKTEILKLYRNGVSSTSIGKKFDRHHDVIRNIIMSVTHENLSTRKFLKVSLEERDRLRELKEKGFNNTEVAKLTGHSPTFVRKVTDDSPMKHHKTFSEADRQNLREAFKEGLSLRATARKFDTAASSVKFWFDKFRRGL
jgi:transposase-like protein